MSKIHTPSYSLDKLQVGDRFMTYGGDTMEIICINEKYHSPITARRMSLESDTYQSYSYDMNGRCTWPSTSIVGPEGQLKTWDAKGPAYQYVNIFVSNDRYIPGAVYNNVDDAIEQPKEINMKPVARVKFVVGQFD